MTYSSSPSAFAYSYTTTYREGQEINFDKIMEAYKIPEEYYNKKIYGASIGEWLKIHKKVLPPVTPENHLPDELFEI